MPSLQALNNWKFYSPKPYPRLIRRFPHISAVALWLFRFFLENNCFLEMCITVFQYSRKTKRLLLTYLEELPYAKGT